MKSAFLRRPVALACTALAAALIPHALRAQGASRSGPTPPASSPAAPSSAASAPAATAPAAEGAAFPPVLDTVTVTGANDALPRRAVSATKTQTPLAETPQSVTVIGREQIAEQAAASIQDVLLYAAGVRSSAYGVDSRGDWARVRGADPVNFLDGLQLNYGFNNTPRIEPYTLERLEVLRGPSSVLYGQGSTAGLINMATKLPEPEAYREIGLQLGSHNRRQLQADLTGPLDAEGRWLYRLVAVGRESDTQVDFVEDDRLVLAPSLTWQPDARTRLTVLAHWQRDRSGSTETLLPWYGVVLPNENGRIPTHRFVSEPDFDRYDTERKSLGWQFERQFGDDWTLRQNARFTYSSGDYKQLYPLSNFIDPHKPYIDAAGNPVPGEEGRVVSRWMYVNERRTHVFGIDQHLEGRVRTGALEHRLLAGLDFSRYGERQLEYSAMSTPLDLYDPVYGNFQEPTPERRPDSEQRQIGAYLQDQIHLGPRWLAVLGLRRDRATTDVEGQDESRDWATTQRAALMYLGAAGWSPYVSYSESFLPIPGTDVFDQRWEPLRGEQWELGLRYAPEELPMQFHAALYHLREENRQVPDPNDPNNQVQTGETQTRGVELEWKGRLWKQLDLVASWQYTDLDEDLEGLPARQASVWGVWRFARQGAGGFSAGFGARYMSSFRDGGGPEVPSLSLFDALLAYDTPRWRLALNGTNLSDKTYVSTCLRRGDCWYGARRTVTATATYRF